MNDKKVRNIGMHVQLLAILVAALTLFASTGMLIGGLVLLPALAFLPAGDIPLAAPLEAGLLGLGSLAALFAIGNLMLGMSAAYGLFKRRPWGRTLGMLDCGLSLPFFPFGTIYGAYGLWVLLPQDAVDYLNQDDVLQLKAAH